MQQVISKLAPADLGQELPAPPHLLRNCPLPGRPGARRARSAGDRSRRNGDAATAGKCPGSRDDCGPGHNPAARQPGNDPTPPWRQRCPAAKRPVGPSSSPPSVPVRAPPAGGSSVVLLSEGSARGAGSGSGGDKLSKQHLQNGVNTWNGLPLWFRISHGSCSNAALKFRTSSPASRQCFLDHCIAGRHRRLIAAVPEHRAALRFPGQRRSGPPARSPPETEPAAGRGQLLSEGAERLMQPPAGCAARQPGSLLLRRPDEDRHHRPAACQSRLQRRIVFQPQVQSEPENGGCFMSPRHL